MALLESPPVEPWPTLAIETAQLHFELDNLGFKLVMLLDVMNRPEDDTGVPADIAWFRIGRSQFATHPGETAPNYSHDTRRLLTAGASDEPGTPTFVLGLTQDALGYILRSAFFAADAPYPDAAYLTSVSLGKDTGPRLSALQALIGRAQQRDAKPLPAANKTGTKH